MGLFDRKKPKIEEQLNVSDKPAKPEDIEKDYDLTGLLPEEIKFMKALLETEGVAVKAMLKVKPHLTYYSAAVEANRYLRKLRTKPFFWDIMGMGYGDLKDIITNLKLSKPEKAVDVIMKVNKEDVERHEHSGTIYLIKEPDLDE